MALLKSGPAPSSTYRVQLHGGFTFADLGRQAGYFQKLGISDLYLSPIHTAVPGSRHGYDVIDYSEINPELGGGDGFRRMAAALRAGGCAILLDFVPNHMGIAGTLNRWWRDVLENGPLSRYALFFDVQWKPDLVRDHPRVLVPILADYYGKVLEQGAIRLRFDDELLVACGPTTLPLCPETYQAVLDPVLARAATEDGRRRATELLAAVAASATQSRAPAAEPKPEQLEATAALKQELGAALRADPGLGAALEARLGELNGVAGNPRSFDPLDEILGRQHYRLARWQAGTHEINYRRFFAIDTLIGLHMEYAEVFRECHALVGKLIADGDVNGLRIDHIDGLRQPEDYLRRLQQLARTGGAQPLFVVVEKILAADERLPPDWPVHGTTGYEFIFQVANLLVDPDRAARLDSAYRRFRGGAVAYPQLIERSKREIISDLFAEAFVSLGTDLTRVVGSDRLWSDLTRHELTLAVTEIAVHLGVYRTYRRRLDPLGADERRFVEEACAAALAANPRSDPQPFEFVRDLITGVYPPEDSPREFRERVLGWVLTFQQYTGAVMAKSVEDTAFYTYNRLIGLNEVGGDPGVFGGSPARFHGANAARLRESPLSLVASSTHDTKVSEDVRARLYALSELAGEWEHLCLELGEQAARHATVVEGRPQPDLDDQYRFLQVLLGAWPLAPQEVDATLRLRLKKYLRKSVNEAKRHTSYLNKNEAYLEACDRFVDALTSAERAPDFLATFRPFAERISRLGMVNSLAQLALKCTVPGVPDFYQGNEVWDFSLVDPDNRRPVDYDARQALLQAAAGRTYPELLENWRDGGLKLRVTRDLLHLRAGLREVFAGGTYAPVAAVGSFPDRLVSYVRESGPDAVLVVVPRLAAVLGTPPVGPVWEDTRIEPAARPGSWQDALTGRTFAAARPLYLRELFADLPLAVLRGAPREGPPL